MADSRLVPALLVTMVSGLVANAQAAKPPYAPPEAFMNNEVVVVKQAKAGLPTTTKDKRWQSAQLQSFRLYPQRTVRLNDAAANAKLDVAQPLELRVRALASPQQLALLLEWKDESASRVSAKETRVFGDSFAVQFPYVFGEGHRLPYIGMGDEKYPVIAYLGRAADKGLIARTSAAIGFGSSTRQQATRAKMSMEYDGKEKIWRATWMRPLKDDKHDLKRDLVPVAFAVWNGESFERGGNKSLSSWKFLKIEGQKINENYLTTMAFGYGPGEVGDALKGKELAQQSCAACHHFEGVVTAVPDFAPNLSQVGKIATYGYLRDSILKPNEVVVRNLNQNRHYMKTETIEGQRGHPNNAGMMWYSRDEKGDVISKMPSFDYLAPEDVANLLAFLKAVEK